ncbi:cobalt transport protein [Methanosalsum zhilinae DSM 4017]|uniref:Cobalt transport protein n=1 Tax=Methanosalsum zhilinae (strain DSM 4017 / NBRC 107636 / OCM 62 / WeN5) TaxID=679901 RepID=F7XN78_METZD|nr:energy-coupling factor transporter transmembrane component T [Methanosalsum zhilinae]AEH60035.1 cobalt transport protein [Methanosalsum zhilinae DSM 4017]
MTNLFFSYFPGDSFLHRLDPRTKIISLICISIAVFAAGIPEHFATLVILFMICSYISGTGFRAFWHSLKPMMIFFPLIFFMQLFLTQGDLIFSIGPLKPTYEGLELGLTVVTRFVLLILFATILTATTRPSMITNGLERLFRPLPLKAAGITSHDLAAMMSLSIRFIPMFFENARQIREAQISRGMDPRHNILRAVSSISVPLIISSIRDADDLTMAMQSRCYQGISRTYLHELEMNGIDWAVLICVPAILIFVVLY